MEKEKVLDKLSELTMNELLFLVKCLQGLNRCGYAISKTEAPISGTLHKKGLLTKFGKTGTKIKWKVSDDVVQCRSFLKDLVGNEAYMMAMNQAAVEEQPLQVGVDKQNEKTTSKTNS